MKEDNHQKKTSADSNPNSAFWTALLIIGAMVFIIAGGAISFLIISPEFRSSTISGLMGQSDNQMGFSLFVIQILTIIIVSFAILKWLGGNK